MNEAYIYWFNLDHCFMDICLGRSTMESKMYHHRKRKEWVPAATSRPNYRLRGAPGVSEGVQRRRVYKTKTAQRNWRENYCKFGYFKKKGGNYQRTRGDNQAKRGRLAIASRSNLAKGQWYTRFARESAPNQREIKR